MLSSDLRAARALTRAQRKFLVDTVGMGSLGFSSDVLEGAETAMARRLEAAGLLKLTHFPQHHGNQHWQITDAGRRAITKAEQSEPTHE